MNALANSLRSSALVGRLCSATTAAATPRQLWKASSSQVTALSSGRIATLPNFPSLRPGSALSSTALYHSSTACRTPEEDKDDPLEESTSSVAGRIWTDELLAEIHDYRQREISSLNMFLTHPSTPRVLGWYYPEGGNDPVVSLTDVLTNVLEEDEELDDDEDEETLYESIAAPTVRRPRPRWSCLNRNARYGGKANKGKRPVSRQARRRKKRSIGNHRR